MTSIAQTKTVKPSRSEAKADTTTRIAKMIIESEAAKRDTNTERLRQARLAREASEAAAAKPGRAARRRRD